jgi:Ca2+-binding EF-hand superfamily protein
MNKMSVAALALVVACGTALAAESATTSTAPKKHPTFESLDKNKDGFLESKEVSSHSGLKKAFATLDTNKDGKLSKDEYAKWQ